MGGDGQFFCAMRAVTCQIGFLCHTITCFGFFVIVAYFFANSNGSVKLCNIIFLSFGHTMAESGDWMTEFFCPTKIWSGEHALDILRSHPAKRVLLVTDSYFSKTGKAREIGNLLPNAEVRIFDEVRPDPNVELTAKGAAVCTQFRPELLLALGGGSSMDCAKGIRLAAECPMEFIAIPTTSGSGSEVTSFSVLSRGEVKYPLVDPLLRPDGAILDAELLRELPKSLIADTGMDLLAHCVEALAASNSSTITDALAMGGVQVVFRDLAASYSGDLSVRGNVHEAATMAGLAFDHAGLGLCHAMAHVLGGMTHLPHGRLCAMLLPHVMEVNAAAVLPKYAHLARICGFGGATERLSFRNLLAAMNRLRISLGMPATLREVGAAVEDENAMICAVLADLCCKTNPRIVDEKMIRSVWKAVRG